MKKIIALATVLIIASSVFAPVMVSASKFDGNFQTRFERAIYWDKITEAIEFGLANNLNTSRIRAVVDEYNANWFFADQEVADFFFDSAVERMRRAQAEEEFRKENNLDELEREREREKWMMSTSELRF